MKLRFPDRLLAQRSVSSLSAAMGTGLDVSIGVHV
jgi:hypothetical protein